MPLTPADLGTHPPKPRLALRVGITGHRDLSHDLVDTLRAEIDKVLLLVASAMSSLPAFVRSCYSDEKPLILIVSPLARGADCLVAQAALDAADQLNVDVHVHAPLPFCRADYEKDATDGEHHYQDWLDQHRRLRDLPSTTVLELDGSHATQDSRDQAYLAVGHLVAEWSDVVIALWDGKPSNGPGGTGDIVPYARSQGKLIAHIDRAGTGTRLLLPHDEEAALPRLDQLLQDTLLMAPIAPDLAPAEAVVKLQEQIKGAREYFHCRQNRWTLGVFYGVVNTLLSRLRPSLPKFRVRDYVDKSNEDWQHPATIHFDDAARRLYQRFDAWADNLAIYYADWTRSSFTWNYLAGAISLILGLVHLATPEHGGGPHGAAQHGGVEHAAPPQPHGLGLVYTEVALGISVLAVFLIARAHQVRERWVDYRRLSERLRWTTLQTAIGATWRSRSQPSTELAELLGHSPWVDWYLIAIFRQTGLPAVRLDAEYLEHYRRLLVDRVKGQLDHHESRVKVAEAARRRIRSFAMWTFGIGLIVSMIRAYPGLPADLGNTLLAITASFTVLSASAAGFAGTADYSKLVQSSRALIPQMHALILRLDKAPPTRTALVPLARDVAEVMMQEQDDWVRVFSLKEIEVG